MYKPSAFVFTLNVLVHVICDPKFRHDLRLLIVLNHRCLQCVHSPSLENCKIPSKYGYTLWHRLRNAKQTPSIPGWSPPGSWSPADCYPKKSPDTYNHPKLNQEDISHLNRSITQNEIEAAIKRLPKRKVQNLMDSL
jgi:hypothetical protein